MAYGSMRVALTAYVLYTLAAVHWAVAVGLLTMASITASPSMLWIVAMIPALTAFAVQLNGSYRRAATVESALPAAMPWGGVDTYDSVTGLPTTRLFASVLSRALIDGRESRRSPAIFVIELDPFTLTDELQDSSDRRMVYRLQAARIKSAVRTTDTTARIAERRFAVLLNHVASSDEVAAVALRMQQATALPFVLNGQEVLLTSRIGIALINGDGLDGRLLMESAVRAVAIARAEGQIVSGLESVSVDRTAGDRAAGADASLAA